MAEIKKVGRPAVNATPVTVRIPPGDLALLDRYRQLSTPQLTRPAAIREVVFEHLSKLDATGDLPK